MARLSRIRPVSSTRVSTETYAARSTSTKEKRLPRPPSRRSFAKRSPPTVLASRNQDDGMDPRPLIYGLVKRTKNEVINVSFEARRVRDGNYNDWDRSGKE